jgi:short-subunit dehydrogenase
LVAVVTGASSGIGEAIALRLAREGLRVVLVARREELLRQLAACIHDAGGEAHFITADLGRAGERVRLVQDVRSTCGPVDVLVNNAGVGWYGYATDLPWTEGGDMVELNVTAVAHLTSLILPEMKERDSGHIVNVSSIGGSIPSQGVVLYCATKSFVDALGDGLYRELRGTNVHVGTVRPGLVKGTEFYQSAGALRILVDHLGTTPQQVAASVWRMLRRPRKVAYVPATLRIVGWFEFYFGWLIDRLGPLLLRHQIGRAANDSSADRAGPPRPSSTDSA